jgi:hypothetical protein
MFEIEVRVYNVDFVIDGGQLILIDEAPCRQNVCGAEDACCMHRWARLHESDMSSPPLTNRASTYRILSLFCQPYAHTAIQC